MVGTTGRGLMGVGGVFSVMGVVGSDIEVRVMYGMASLVEEKFASPRTNLGVFGLSNGRSGNGRSLEGLRTLSTLDLPTNISFIPARKFPKLDGGRWRVRVGRDALGVVPSSVSLERGMAADVSVRSRKP